MQVSILGILSLLVVLFIIIKLIKNIIKWFLIIAIIVGALFYFKKDKINFNQLKNKIQKYETF
jgi:hypothetical protein